MSLNKTRKHDEFFISNEVLLRSVSDFEKFQAALQKGIDNVLTLIQAVILKSD